MTDREKAIVMAYTGACMLTGDKFQIFHKYVEDIMGRSVWTHEMALDSIADEIRAKSKDDFIALCVDESSSENPNTCGDAISRQAVLDIITFEDKWLFDAYGHNANTRIAFSGLKSRVKALSSVTPQQMTGRWIIIDDCEQFIAKCSECGRIEDSRMISKYPYCHCGAKMAESED